MSDKKNDVAGHAKQEFSLISNDTLLHLYRGLLQCRLQRGRANTTNGRRGARPNGWRYDAAAVAVAKDLGPDDRVIADAAGRLPGLLTSKSPKRGPRGPNGAGSPDFADELERAIGAALAYKTAQSGKVCVVFSSGNHRQMWTDALEVARAHRLPMLFVSELKDSETRRAGKPRDSRDVQLEPGTELAQITVDGNDVVASYRAAHEAIDRARRNRGATLIECTVFRIGGRRQQDAVANMENYLRGKGLLNRELKQEMLDRIERDAKTRKQ